MGSYTTHYQSRLVENQGSRCVASSPSRYIQRRSSNLRLRRTLDIAILKMMGIPSAPESMFRGKAELP
jgi:hypothetical protein